MQTKHSKIIFKTDFLSPKAPLLVRLPTLPDGCISDSPATTYPRVLPASLPSVSEPDRNQGGSLVLPGLELLPAPETLLNFELETKDGRSVTNL